METPVQLESHLDPDAAPPVPQEPQPEAEPTLQHSALREYFVTTVVCTTFALFVTTYVAHPMTVPTPSMEPTILVGDRLLIDKFTIRNGFYSGVPLTPKNPIRRGDVVVFKFPRQPEVLYVKRAIGLPGETLEIRNKRVLVNGNPLDEPYKAHSDSYTYPHSGRIHLLNGDLRRDNLNPILIPENSYFVMGDNRDDSADSRYWGVLPRNYIVGTPLFVFWSYQDESDAYLKSTLTEILWLYGERILFFIPRTRWSRMGHVIQ